MKKAGKFKKILKWIGIPLLLLLVIIIALPFIFKGKLIEIAKQEINKSINATVDFGDFDLTLFSSFPDFKFDIEDVSVTGVNEYEGVQLASIKNTSINLDLMSVISGGKIEVKSIEINEPTINIIVNKDSIANYDIAKTSEELDTISSEDSEPLEYDLGLQKLTITNANISYKDAISNVSSVVKNMNFDLSGDFTQDVFDTKTSTSIEELTVTEGVVNYLNKTNVNLDAEIAIDKFVKYSLKENSLKLNELELGFDGFVEMLEGKMAMDLTFNSKKTDFKSILSLVPTVYLEDFSSITTKGNLALNGNAKGDLVGESYPAFNLNMAVTDGFFKYPDLPNSADNINIKTQIKHPQGDLDKMKIDVSKLHLELADNPIDATLKMSTPMSDPKIESNIKADLDLEKLKTVVPMQENEKLNGMIHADLNLAGKMSAITDERYQDFKADGELTVKDMLYVSKDLPYDVNVNEMEMIFSPQFVDLKSLDTKIGNSDIKAVGKIDNILPYIFNDEVLSGNMMITSNKMDIDDLTRTVPSEGGEQAAETDSSYEVIRVPKYYNLALTTDIKEMIYDGETIKNVKGKVAVKDQIANLTGVSMDMLDGNVVLNGSYNTQATNPKVNFDYKVNQVDITKTAAFFGSFETIAPIAKYCKGKISTSLSVNSELDQNMEPIYNSISGGGDLFSNNLTVSGVKSLQKIADILKLESLATQNLKKLNMAFKFTNGRVVVNPFNINMSGISTAISGSTGFDETISYQVDMDVPRAKLGAKANEIVEGLLGKVKVPGTDLKLSAIIPVNFEIGGTVTKPIVKNNLKLKTTNIVTAIKDKVVDTIKKTFNKEIDKIMADAQLQAQKVRDEAKVQSDKLRAEGVKLTNQAKVKADEIANQAKVKADEEAAKLAGKGSNPFEKIANAKVAEIAKKTAYIEIEKKKKTAYTKAELPTTQAEDKATKLEAEADKQANKIMELAEQKANGLKQ